MPNTIDRLHVQSLSASTVVLPSSVVSNAQVAAGAEIAADKMQHRFKGMYSQVGTATAAADRKCVHVVAGATAEVQSFRAGLRTACTGDSTVTVDLKKNGSSILSSALVIDSGDAAYALLSATFSSDDLVADDVLEVTVAVSAGSGTLGTGVFAECVVDEASV